MAIRTVSNAAQLTAAFAVAAPGDRIVLNAGNYGAVDLKNHDFAGTVTIASAVPGRAVVGNLNVQNVSNVRFEGIRFDYETSASKQGGQPFKVTNSSKIAFSKTSFDGDLAGGYAVGTGLHVTNSSQVTLESSTMTGFHRATYFYNVTGLAVRGNDLSAMAGDGITFAQITGGRIEGNYIHHMRGNPASGYHKDLIQGWTEGTSRPSTDVVIRGNALHTGDGSTQSIFMGNSLARAGNKAMYWRNIVIEDNTIVAGHVHGIYVAQANGLAIRGNTVVQDMTTGLNGSINVPRIDVTPDSLGVSITGNIAHAISGKAGWAVVNNQIVGKGYKVGGSLEDKAQAGGAPAAPAPTVPEVDDGPDGGPDAGGPQTPAPIAPTPPAAPSVGLASPQSPAFYAETARKLGLTLKTGVGDQGDNLVLASAAGNAHGNGGDDVLVGNNGGGTLYGGTGNDVHAGLG
ncbi:MAG TPA: right-handed parallel beta-helix repeat-containing protein, partial [Caulobacteraceae bacterium]|nr:right-handed parallel beta-helix repeat-containing protein [Caulobacteraceae bacterium]